MLNKMGIVKISKKCLSNMEFSRHHQNALKHPDLWCQYQEFGKPVLIASTMINPIPEKTTPITETTSPKDNNPHGVIS